MSQHSLRLGSIFGHRFGISVLGDAWGFGLLCLSGINPCWLLGVWLMLELGDFCWASMLISCGIGRCDHVVRNPFFVLYVFSCFVVLSYHISFVWFVSRHHWFCGCPSLGNVWRCGIRTTPGSKYQPIRNLQPGLQARCSTWPDLSQKRYWCKSNLKLIV